MVTRRRAAELEWGRRQSRRGQVPQCRLGRGGEVVQENGRRRRGRKGWRDLQGPRRGIVWGVLGCRCWEEEGEEGEKAVQKTKAVWPTSEAAPGSEATREQHGQSGAERVRMSGARSRCDYLWVTSWVHSMDYGSVMPLACVSMDHDVIAARLRPPDEALEEDAVAVHKGSPNVAAGWGPSPKDIQSAYLDLENACTSKGARIKPDKLQLGGGFVGEYGLSRRS